LKFDLIRERLRNQRLMRTEFEKPEQVVSWLGAVQSQDYTGAKWALGQRTKDARDDAIDEAFNAGRILRTHVMRPTWHFVAPDDIRWLLELAAPRVHALSAPYYRKFELDDAIYGRSRKILERALRGGRHLTRKELGDELGRGGIAASGIRLTFLMLRFELDRVICSGVRRGKQFTYALFDERVPKSRKFRRDEALVELILRYFSSHGPATIRDFVWWSGLTTADAKAGIQSVKPALTSETIGERTYWFKTQAKSAPRVSPSASLLPNYDEFLIAYKDRDQKVFGLDGQPGKLPAFDAFAHYLVVDGLLAGTWRRTEKAGSTLVSVTTFAPLDETHSRELALAAKRLSKFIGRTVVTV
jgi:DNA glycosylase AlkZ-like